MRIGQSLSSTPIGEWPEAGMTKCEFLGGSLPQLFEKLLGDDAKTSDAMFRMR